LSLERRDCPSLTVTLFGGSLVRGTPAGELTVSEPGPGRLTVSDNGQPLGAYAVTGDLLLSLNSHPKSVTVDLGGNTFAGNVLLNLGNGGPAPFAAVVQHGTLGGNVTFLGGSNVEIEVLGGPSVPLAVRGTVQAVGKLSPVGLASLGNNLIINPGCSVGGDVTTTQIDNVLVGQGFPPLTTIGGNLTIKDTGPGAALLVNDFGSVGKNVSVTGTSPLDGFILAPAGPGVGGTVLGNLFLDVGAATLEAGTMVGGSATLSTHGPAPTLGPPASFIVDGTVNGSLTVNLGAANTLAFGATASVGGNGNDSVTVAGPVGGGLSFHFGSGNDTVAVSSAPGGPLRWAGGNGNDSLTLAPAAAGTGWNVNVLFGSGDDSFTLAGAGGFISGSVDGGGTNVFTQGAGWAIVPPWTLQNF
jgi:hypothetical protein